MTVLDALAAGSGGAFAFDWQEFGWGCEYYARTGRMMAEDGLAVLKDFDAIYFGAVGWPGVPDHISLWGLRLAICQNFDQWANVRPVRFLPGVQSPLRKADDTELDWVVVRENSEGEYAGLGGRNLSARGPGSEVAVQTALFTETGCERIMRFAFDLARTRTRRKVSSVTKSNAQQYGMVLWDDVFKRVAVDYPDVETESVLVDAMSAKFVLHPEDLSVVVASNLHADILSDLGSALAGSLGLAASANLNPERRFPSMFEPVHGSAPDIAGQGLANPIGAVGSAALMLDHLGLPEQAARLQTAIEATTAAGILTRDLGGTASTDDVTKALIDALNPLARVTGAVQFLGCAAALSAVPLMTAVLVVVIAAGQQHATHARNRPGAGQQGRGRFLGALAAAGHPGRDQPGHDGGRERSPAPLRQAGERPFLPDIGLDLAGVGTAAHGVDEVLARCVHVDPAPVVAEVRPVAPVGRERPDGENVGECAWPGRPPGVVVARLGDADGTLVQPKLLQPGFQRHRRDVLPGQARGRYVDDLGAEAECRP